MKKITILALHLGYGGIERSICLLANNLANKYDVEIISTYKVCDKIPYNLDKNVKVKYLMNDKPNKQEFINSLKKFKIINILKEGLKSIRILFLKKRLMVNFVKKCDSDVLISTRDFHNSIVGKYGSNNTMKIGWEHNHHNSNKKYLNKVCNSVKNLDYFVLVSQELYNDYKCLLNNINCKCVYIPNMIENKQYNISNLKNNNLVTISRLSPEKGLFDLVDVIELIENKHIKLNIIGDGQLKNELQNYIRNKKLEDKIDLLGYKDSNEVHKILENSSLYVMTSFTESFGIVLLEAFSHGIPAVAFDSAQGAKQLINSKNGMLIANRDKIEMAKFIDKFLLDSKLRENMSKAAINSIDEYKENNVIKKWIDIIN